MPIHKLEYHIDLVSRFKSYEDFVVRYLICFNHKLIALLTRAEILTEAYVNDVNSNWKINECNDALPIRGTLLCWNSHYPLLFLLLSQFH